MKLTQLDIADESVCWRDRKKRVKDIYGTLWKGQARVSEKQEGNREDGKAAFVKKIIAPNWQKTSSHILKNPIPGHIRAKPLKIKDKKILKATRKKKKITYYPQ